MIVRKRRVVITGGHLSPAWATIVELKKRKRWEVVYLGRQTATEGTRAVSDEARLIPGLGARFVPLVAGRWPRKWDWRVPGSFLKIVWGWGQAMRILGQVQPDVVVSFGGYLSVPVVVSARILGVPVVTHEQTRTAGLANRINGWFAKRVAVAFEGSKKFFPSSKVVVVGNPVRQEVSKRDFRMITRLRRGLKGRRPILYVTGGNQGARDINLPLISGLPLILAKYNLIHQVGGRGVQKKSWRKIEEFLRSYPRLESHYYAQEYFGPEEIGGVFGMADLVVSRAGANTVSELALLGKPAILIPLPGTYNEEQLENARGLAQTGLGVVIEEKDLNPEKLVRKIDEVMGNLEKYRSRAEVAKKSLVVPDAAEKLASLIEEVAEENWKARD